MLKGDGLHTRGWAAGCAWGLYNTGGGGWPGARGSYITQQVVGGRVRVGAIEYSRWGAAVCGGEKENTAGWGAKREEERKRGRLGGVARV